MNENSDAMVVGGKSVENELVTIDTKHRRVINKKDTENYVGDSLSANYNFRGP